MSLNAVKDWRKGKTLTYAASMLNTTHGAMSRWELDLGSSGYRKVPVAVPYLIELHAKLKADTFPFSMIWDSILTECKDFTPDVVVSYLRESGRSPKELASWLHCSPSAVASWGSGDSKPTGPAQLLLKLLLHMVKGDHATQHDEFIADTQMRLGPLTTLILEGRPLTAEKWTELSKMAQMQITMDFLAESPTYLPEGLVRDAYEDEYGWIDWPDEEPIHPSE